MDASPLRTSSMMRDSAGLETLVRSTSMALKSTSARASDWTGSFLSIGFLSNSGSENRLYVGKKFLVYVYFLFVKTIIYDES